jgi:hypothetical protein
VKQSDEIVDAIDDALDGFPADFLEIMDRPFFQTETGERFLNELYEVRRLTRQAHANSYKQFVEDAMNNFER